MIAIVDYGCGNPGSIKNMLKKAGFESVITSGSAQIEGASKIILPGVGAFDTGMKSLRDLGLLPVLNKKAIEEKKPVLGICLGMQLMTKKSEEGKEPGLGWMNAETLRFPADGKTLKIPNMGWNFTAVKKKSVLFTDNLPDHRYYFVHSYYVNCENPHDVIATAEYGTEYVCAFERENIYGVQFHPEKSHKYGMQLLKNFASL